jgi:tetratricopeptide (TPR) repeat protein
MVGKKHILIGAFLVIISFHLNATYRSEVYSAYINNKMDQWKSVIDRMDKITDKNNDLLVELVNYQYGYIGYCIGFNKKDEARKYLSAAQKNLEILERNKYNPAVIDAYKSAFYGFRIELSPLTAPVNGLKSIEHAKKSIKLDPDFYFGYIQQGNIQFYMPTAFGGSKKEALEHYMKAKNLLERDPSEVSGNWNYMSLLIVIGQTHTYLKDYESAKKIYEDILNTEPGFSYVRDDLYPGLLKKMEK